MKKFVFILMAVYSVASEAVCPSGGTCGPATRYDVTLLEVALCQNASCTQSYTVASGAKVFNIASAAVGESLGSYANFNNVPPATYTHLRFISSRTFTITGAAISTCSAQNAASLSVPNGEAPLNVDGLALLDFGSSGRSLTWNDAAKTQMKGIAPLTTPITITHDDDAPEVRMAFGTKTALACVSGYSFPSPPDVTVDLKYSR